MLNLSSSEDYLQPIIWITTFEYHLHFKDPIHNFYWCWASRKTWRLGCQEVLILASIFFNPSARIVSSNQSGFSLTNSSAVIPSFDYSSSNSRCMMDVVGSSGFPWITCLLSSIRRSNILCIIFIVILSGAGIASGAHLIIWGSGCQFSLPFPNLLCVLIMVFCTPKQAFSVSKWEYR